MACIVSASFLVYHPPSHPFSLHCLSPPPPHILSISPSLSLSFSLTSSFLRPATPPRPPPSPLPPPPPLRPLLALDIQRNNMQDAQEEGVKSSEGEKGPQSNAGGVPATSDRQAHSAVRCAMSNTCVARNFPLAPRRACRPLGSRPPSPLPPPPSPTVADPAREAASSVAEAGVELPPAP
jgi:hypothetical protein